MATGLADTDFKNHKLNLCSLINNYLKYLMEPKVLLCIVHPGHVSARTFFSVYYMEKPKTFEIAEVEGTNVAKQRNVGVKGFLKTDFTHLFFVDSDMILPKNALIKLLSTDKDVITGLYFQKKEPFFPIIGKKSGDKLEWLVGYPQNSIIDVEYCGMGCCLIKRNVLEVMLPKLDVIGELPQFFSYANNLSEDIFFCDKAMDSGFKIFCDTSVKCGHIRQSVVTEADFLRFKNSIVTE